MNSLKKIWRFGCYGDVFTAHAQFASILFKMMIMPDYAAGFSDREFASFVTLIFHKVVQRNV